MSRAGGEFRLTFGVMAQTGDEMPNPMEVDLEVKRTDTIADVENMLAGVVNQLLREKEFPQFTKVHSWFLGFERLHNGRPL